MVRARDEDIHNELLISEVELRPALYDQSLKEYWDANLKKMLWEEVCVNVFSTIWTQLSRDQKTQAGVLVRRRWKSLRTCFSRELHEQKYVRPLLTAKKRQKYRYYDELLFLLPFLQVRETALQVLETSGNREDVVNDKEEEEIGEVCTPSSDTPNKKKRKNYEEDLEVILRKKTDSSDVSDSEKHFTGNNYEESQQNIFREEKHSSDIIDAEKHFAGNNCEESQQDILQEKKDSSDIIDSEKHFAGNNCEESQQIILREEKDSSDIVDSEKHFAVNNYEVSRQDISLDEKDSSDIIDSIKHSTENNCEESRQDVLREKKDFSDIIDPEKHSSRKNYEDSRRVILREKKNSSAIINSKKHFARKNCKENRQDILREKKDSSDIELEKLFALSLVPTLKALPPHLRVHAKIQILQVFRNIHNHASPGTHT